MDRGASVTEYAAVTLLAAAVGAVVFTTGIGDRVRDMINDAVCSIQSGEECSDATGSSGEDTGPDSQEDSDSQQPESAQNEPQVGDGVLDETTNAAVVPASNGGEPADGDGDESQEQECDPEGPDSDHGRRDAGRDSANTDDRDTSRRTDANDSNSGTCGTPAPSDSGLGDPESGDSVDVPDPPPWEPPDEGAGEWGSEDGMLNVARQRTVRLAAESGANAMAGAMPNASRNLLHYLANSGDPLEQDVDQILEDVPEFSDEVDSRNERIAQAAVEQAQDADIDEPTTFPVNTPWDGFYINKEMSSDWFFGMGGIQYNVTGQVTVYPPDEPGGEYRYEMDTATNIRDQYNWDGGKGVELGPLDIDDDTLGDLHRAGVAQEFMMHGRSESETREGTVE